MLAWKRPNHFQNFSMAQLAANVRRFQKLFGQSLGMKLVTYAFNSSVKLSGTAGQRFLKLTDSEAIVHLKNRPKVQNHIKGIHACGMALAGETATGGVFVMSVPKDSLPVLKSMTIEYKRICQGDITATAVMPESERIRVQSSPKGDVVVPVKFTDSSGAEPCVATYTWAWIPRKRKDKPAADGASADKPTDKPTDKPSPAV